MALTDKQQRFVEEYLIDLNATQAAIRAGYSPNSAEAQASRMLSIVKVRDAVARAMAERSKRTGVCQDRVVQELARIAFLNPSDVVNLNSATVKEDVSEDDLAVIASVKNKTTFFESGSAEEHEVKFCDKVKTLELLGRHLGMFNDKLRIDTEPVIIYGGDLLED